MSKKLKRLRTKIILGAILFVLAVVIEHMLPNISDNIVLVAFLVSYFVVGGDVVKKAAQNIVTGQMLDEHFLMVIATVGAFLVAEYPEAVAVMLFYQVGEFFQGYAVNRSRKSIAELMDIRPDCAYVIRDGETVEVDPDEVALGETIVVKPGERVPLDGVVVKGNTTLDTMALTGESVPREALLGENVISGCVNLTGLIEVKVTKIFTESTVSKILELVENASSRKAEAENFITKFARYYTPIVVGCAALLAVIPPLLTGGNWTVWIYRALTFLVISCPCALVISIPLSFFGGIGGASKAGILIKGSNYLEALAEAETIICDKTGTLTKGNFNVVTIEGDAQTLELAALAEMNSNHPIAKAIHASYGKDVDKTRVAEVIEVAGKGMHAVIDGTDIYVGNQKLMEMQQITVQNLEDVGGTVVYVARDNQYLGYILIADELKEDAVEAVKGWKQEGMKHIVMLTGDRTASANATASTLGITEVHSELLPVDKVNILEKYLAEKTDKGKVIFVGDGINDAPVLARTDIGIAMGGLGSDAAIEAADIVIMNDAPSKISQAIKISKKTLLIVKENIVFAIGVKVLVLLLAAVGYANMWAAVFADVGVAVIAILNAMRALQVSDR